MSKILELIAQAKEQDSQFGEYEFGFFTNFQSQQILQIAKFRVHNVRKIITTDAIKHILKEHGDHKDQKERGQVGVTEADIDLIPKIVAGYDSIEQGNPKHGKSVMFYKIIGDKRYGVAMKYQSNQGNPKLEVRTMYIKPIKKADV